VAIPVANIHEGEPMMLLPDTAVRILAAGGGLIVESSGYLPDTLARMAAAAASGGSRLTIRINSVFLPDTMVRIGALGKGQVEFDLAGTP
jgi:hypothetical protein